MTENPPRLQRLRGRGTGFLVLAAVTGLLSFSGCSLHRSGEATPTTVSSRNDPIFRDNIEIAIEDGSYLPNSFTARRDHPITVSVDNRDEEPHDIILRDPTRPIHIFLLPEKRVVTSFFFTKSGRYEFFCSQPGHAAAGMRGEIVVSENIDR